MSLQEIIVIAIVFFCVNYIGIRVVNYFRNIKQGKNPCATCTSGCELKRMYEEKKEECGRKQQCCQKKLPE